MPSTINQQVFEGERQMAVVLDSVEAIPSSEANPGQALGEAIKSHMPEALGSLLERVGGDSELVLDSVVEGVRAYQDAHGRMPDAGLMRAGIQQFGAHMVGFTPDASGGFTPVLDSVATSSTSETTSLQVNRAITSMLGLFESAIPFAAYLPFDIGSNQALLAIMTHTANSSIGGYTAGDMLNGSRLGRPYGSNSRAVRFPTLIPAPVTLKCTARNNAAGTSGDAFGSFCDQSLPGVPINRGQTIITVNGLVAAEEGSNANGATSPMSGTIKLGSVEYTISAATAPDAGTVTINSINPDLPAGAVVEAEVFINYTKAPGLTPEVGINVQTWRLTAGTERILTSTDIDAQTQLIRELNIDAASQQLRAARSQLSMERYFRALKMAYDVSSNTVLTHEFDMAVRSGALLRNQIWQDFGPTLSAVSQIIAEKTMDYGAEFAYVDRRVTAELQGLPSTMFQQSGQRPSAGIWRVGRLFNMVDVYSIPDGTGMLTGDPAAGVHEMLLIGRGSDPGRAPVVLGDAVPTMLMDLAVNKDFVTSRGMYARNFTKRNPHQPSALGCARINITGLV